MGEPCQSLPLITICEAQCYQNVLKINNGSHVTQLLTANSYFKYIFDNISQTTDIVPSCLTCQYTFHVKKWTCPLCQISICSSPRILIYLMKTQRLEGSFPSTRGLITDHNFECDSRTLNHTTSRSNSLVIDLLCSNNLQL